MIPVAIWSKFPTSLLVAKIIPKLNKRGIDVIKIMSPGTQDADLSNVVCVLLMGEMASHAEANRCKQLAFSRQKKLLPLSRKESSWKKTIESLKKIGS